MRVSQHPFVRTDKLSNRQADRHPLWISRFGSNQNTDDHNDDDTVNKTKPKAARGSGNKSKRSVISKVLLDELKRPARDAKNVEKILKAINTVTILINNGLYVIAEDFSLAVQLGQLNGALQSAVVVVVVHFFCETVW